MHCDRRQIITSAMAMTAAGMFPSFAQGQERLVIDAIGLHTHLNRPAERVVIASHHNYEDFTAIAGQDAWAKVVGMAREPWEDWRAAEYTHYAKAIPGLGSIPDVGTLGTEFDADKVIALRPDVVLLDALTDGLIGNQLHALRRAGLPVVFVNFQSETPQKHLASIHAISRVMGTEGRAATIAKLYEAAWLDVMNRAAASPQWSLLSCYAELAQQGPEIIGFTDINRLWGGMAQQLGVRNIARDIPDYGGPLPKDVLFSEDPEFIFFAGSSWSSDPKGVRTGYEVEADVTRRTLAAYAARPGYEALKAVKAGNVHAVEHTLAWSLRDVYAMQYMAKQFYPEQFADIDPMKGLADFHAKFLPVPFSGTWFASLK
jgi:iron complex transport system substrate-binding protein